MFKEDINSPSSVLINYNKTMIIGIDISSIQYGTGVGNYTLNLVKNLIKIDKKNTYKLLYISLRNPLPPEITKLKSPQVKIYHYHLPITFLIYVWNNLNILPIELFIGRCHVFHTSDYYHTPSIKAKLITTVHDLSAFLYPNWLHKNIVLNHQLKFKYKNKYAYFICVSKSTKNDLLKLFLEIDESILSVVYEAGESKYQKFNNLKYRQKQKVINIFKRKYLLTNYLLAQGTREPRKNLHNLIKAFILFKDNNPDSNLQLAITGKYGWGEDITEKQPDYIKILGYLPESDMVPAHAAALALIYPSFYEGFGLPILKAMAVGTPVITSQNTSMSEISNNSALLVNPSSVEDISKAILKIYQNDTFRKNLSLKGILNAKKFSWTKTATDTLFIYEKIC